MTLTRTVTSALHYTTVQTTPGSNNPSHCLFKLDYTAPAQRAFTNLRDAPPALEVCVTFSKYAYRVLFDGE
jgi:hypothetical protein